MCPHCDRPAELEPSNNVYPCSNVDYGWFWVCWLCEARIGCHKGTSWPLGTLAGSELRAARRRAHQVFDSLRRAKMRKEGVGRKVARRAGYRWLAKELSLKGSECHIAMFDLEKRQQVVDVCIPYLRLKD